MLDFDIDTENHSDSTRLPVTVNGVHVVSCCGLLSNTFRIVMWLTKTAHVFAPRPLTPRCKKACLTTGSYIIKFAYLNHPFGNLSRPRKPGHIIALSLQSPKRLSIRALDLVLILERYIALASKKYASAIITFKCLQLTYIRML